MSPADRTAPEPSGLTHDLRDLASDLPLDWAPDVQAFLDSPTGQALRTRLMRRHPTAAVIYPADPFRALRLTQRHQVRAVVVGQDPYHGPHQAQGLAFSVAPGLPCPPSLRNILKERTRDLNAPMPQNGDLSTWAHQGILLLNTTLTVEAAQAGSHRQWGWEVLTHTLIAALAQDPQPKVFMLWGSHAQALLPTDPAPHLCLRANHPSPLSARRGPTPFWGCGHFSKARHWLAQHGAQTATKMPWFALPGDPNGPPPLSINTGSRVPDTSPNCRRGASQSQKVVIQS